MTAGVSIVNPDPREFETDLTIINVQGTLPSIQLDASKSASSPSGEYAGSGQWSSSPSTPNAAGAHAAAAAANNAAIAAPHAAVAHIRIASASPAKGASILDTPPVVAVAAQPLSSSPQRPAVMQQQQQSPLQPVVMSPLAPGYYSQQQQQLQQGSFAATPPPVPRTWTPPRSGSESQAWTAS